MAEYNASTIKTLAPLEHMRQYPGMYIGSKDADGLHHLVKEIVSNSIDEYLNGAGDKISVTICKDGSICIEDNGRGIPHGLHESGCSILQACFGIANTGGKFDNATGETGYNTSGGEHGTGAKAVNALSTTLIVKSYNNSQVEQVEFSKGELVNSTSRKCSPDMHGLFVCFLPDPTVLETTKFDATRIKSMLQEFSFLCTGLTFVFDDEITGEHITFYSDKGLLDFFNYLAKDKAITEPFYFSKQDGKFQLEAIVGYTNNYNSITRLYTNNIPQEKGTHLTGFKTAWTQGLNQFARNKKLLKEKDNNLTGSDLEEGQVMILNFKMIDPVFKGQNKEELSSSEGRTYVQRFTSEAIKENEGVQEKFFKIIFEKAVAARKAREAAKRARDNARKIGNNKKQKLLNLPTKLVDCWSKNRLDCELLISEGDSAASGLIECRNAEINAIFPIRGKIIAAYKNSSEKIFANKEVINLIKAIGLDLDSKTNKLIYDIKKLRYGKILLCADADPDGASIRNLLIEMFWWLCPELILNGHLYTTMPPLFRITTKKNEYIYLKDETELNKYKNEHKNDNFLINRNKGLGEQDSEELADTLVNPKTRNIAQIIVKDEEEAKQMIEMLLGSSVPPRRQFLLQHEGEANESD